MSPRPASVHTPDGRRSPPPSPASPLGWGGGGGCGDPDETGSWSASWGTYWSLDGPRSSTQLGTISVSAAPADYSWPILHCSASSTAGPGGIFGGLLE